MWLQTPYGFFSAVLDKTDPTGTSLQIRTRARRDAEYLRDWLVIEHSVEAVILRWPNRDYPWRIRTTHELWGSFLVYAAEEIDYTNFKDKVKTINPQRAALYARAWSVFYEIEKEDGDRQRRPVWSGVSSYSGNGKIMERQLELDAGDPDLIDEAELVDLHSMSDAEFEAWMRDEHGVEPVIVKSKPKSKRSRKTKR